MENHKIDRLFREKSESFEVFPTEDAWKAISGQIHPKENSYWSYWKVAAVILVMIASGIWAYQNIRTASGEMTLAAEYPKRDLPLDLPQVVGVTIAEIQTEKEEVDMVKKAQETQADKSIEYRPTLGTIASIGTGNLVKTPDYPQLPELTIIQESKKTSVVIRYYAQAPDSSEVKGKKGLGQLLAKAQTFRPGELLADLRAAKDDLFQSSKRN